MKKILIIIFGFTLVLGQTSCGIFKKGCNCPKVKTASTITKSELKSV